jgi:diketogulonate reductase-like aldo/keto reductase
VVSLSSPSRIAQNIDLFGFSPTDEEMSQITKLDKYVSYKTNPNLLSAAIGGADQFCEEGADIFDADIFD